MKTDFNILVSSAGRRVALLEIFRAALREAGLSGRVLAADMSRLSSAFHSADEGFLVPRCSSEDFIPRLLDLCRAHRVDLLVPTIDTELPMLAESRDAFAAIGTTVAISPPATIAIGGDKRLTHEWLVRSGLPTVRQTTVAEMKKAPGDWPFPLIVKPRFGSSSLGVARVRSMAELDVFTADKDYVVQSIARGDEYTIDFLVARDGRCVCAVPRKRLEVRAGEVSKAVTVASAPLDELARRVCDSLPGAYGILNVQVFLDPASGETAVIEVNPRFGGGFPLAWESGGRFPLWMIQEVLGLPSTASSTGWRAGVVMLRYDSAVFTEADAVGLSI